MRRERGEAPPVGQRISWPMWRLRQQLVALGFDTGWAHETAARLAVLRDTVVDGENALTHVCANSETARRAMGIRHRSTLYRYLQNGHLMELVRGRHPGKGWITDQLFLRADCEYLRILWMIKSPDGLGPVPWEPPSEQEIEAWIERHGGFEAVLAMLPTVGEADEEPDEDA